MKLNPRTWSPLAWVLSLSVGFFVLFLVISASVFMTKSGGKTSYGGKSNSGFFSSGSVGVLEVNGVIMDSRRTLEKFKQLEEDEDVKAIVIRLNSPGGSVAPSQEIYEAIKRSEKPVVASMASVAASGAYYIACGAKKVFANPGTITGSIGVIMEFVNLEKLYDWAKIKRFVIKTGKFKDAGSEFRTMTPEERSLLQSMIDDVLLQFKTAVSEGRKIPLDQVTRIADGRIFSGSQAKKAKLVDELGTLDDAIQAAATMAKIKGKPEVVYTDRKRRRIIEMLLDGGPSDEGSDSYFSAPSSWLGLLQKARSLLVDGDLVGEATPARTQPGVFWIWNGIQ